MNVGFTFGCKILGVFLVFLCLIVRGLINGMFSTYYEIDNNFELF